MRTFLPFPEARAYARSLGLSRQVDWYKFASGNLPSKGQRPANVPSAPHTTYREQGWSGYGDWLGTGRTGVSRQIQWRPFLKARAFARSQKLRRRADWIEFCRGNLPSKKPLPADIPMRPEDLYRDSGWNGYGDWLGSGIVPVQNRKFRSFVEAREFVRSLGLRSSRQWEAFCQGKLPDKGKRPVDIPTCPRRVYQDAGWSGFPDWLGTRTDGNAL